MPAGGPVEFAYHASATNPADRIVPSSPPFTTPELTALDAEGKQGHYSVGTPMYDHDGNLWAGVFGENYTSRGIAIWTKPTGGGQRAISTSACGFVPGKPLQDYVAGDGTTVRKMWAQECKPNYLILQPRSLQTLMSLAEDPQTFNVFAYVMFNGRSFVIDPQGSGPDMTFKVGNVAEGPWQGIMQEQITGGGWVDCTRTNPPDPRCSPCAPSDPGCPLGPVPCNGFGQPACTPPCHSDGPPPGSGCEPCPPGSPAAVRGIIECRWEPDPVHVRWQQVDSKQVFDHSGRAWLTVAQLTPRLPKMYTTMDPLEQYMVSVDPTRLLGRGAQSLTAKDGASTTLQAESTETTSTANVPGTLATTIVDSVAPVGLSAGGGLMLTDETDTASGVPAGTTATYEVVVPKAGSYHVCYRARKASGSPTIRLNVSGSATNHDTPISNTGAAMAMTSGPTLTFTDSGTKTISLTAPSGSQGWQLDSIKFLRNPATGSCG
jgi:hypothetical protein